MRVADSTVRLPGERDPHYMRNAIAFAADAALFHTAINFISISTVLAAFLALLTDSEVVIGIASGILSSAWLLPQLFVAGIASRQKRMLPMLIKAAFLSRPLLFPLALFVTLMADTRPTLTLVVTVAAIFLFFVGDAFASVPWFDLLGRILPPRRRGRVQGIGQIVGGVGGVLAGIVVREILGNPVRFPFPGNYGLLFAIGGGVFMLSGVAVLFIQEPDEPREVTEKVSLGQVFRSMPRVLADDRPFLVLVITKIVAAFSGIASTFYVLYATRELGFTLADTGLFVSAQVTGGILAGLLLGYLQDKWGPRVHMRVVMILAGAVPILALLARPLAGVSMAALTAVYLTLYFVHGVGVGSMGWPFFNWILEYAPEARRPVYIGMLNTLSATAMLAPMIGGAIVRGISYQAVFVVGVCIAAVALLLTRWLPSTRQGE